MPRFVAAVRIRVLRSKATGSGNVQAAKRNATAHNLGWSLLAQDISSRDRIGREGPPTLSKGTAEGTRSGG